MVEDEGVGVSLWRDEEKRGEERRREERKGNERRGKDGREVGKRV